MRVATRKFRLSEELERERETLMGALEPLIGEVLPRDGETFLTTREVALLFRVSPATVRRWSDCGRIEARRSVGGHRMFPIAAVRRVLARLAGIEPADEPLSPAR